MDYLWNNKIFFKTKSNIKPIKTEKKIFLIFIKKKTLPWD